MFRKTKRQHQPSLFGNPTIYLNDRAQKIYDDNQEWHNQFRVQITECIDEDIFRVLFCEDFGAPNSPIRVLVGMIILKESRNWSDAQLFENCLFHPLVRSALGLFNSEDSAPSDATYYNFRDRIAEWYKATGEDLMEKVFVQITKSQMLTFKINGNQIRMDSKLIGSNIAWYGRYILVHETLRLAYNSSKDEINRFMSKSDLGILQELSGEFGGKVSYRSTKDELESRLVLLGSIIYKIIKNLSDNQTKPLETLRAVFEQQYEVIDEVVTPLPKEKIKAATIQSPHDTDCHYRKKDTTAIKGYSANITETCNQDNPVNLIVDIQLEPGSQADANSVIPAIEASQEIIPQKIELATFDGAYHSSGNQAFCEEKGIDYIVSKLPGQHPSLVFKYDENDNLIVTEVATNTQIPATKVKTHKTDAPDKWKIPTPDGKTRVLTRKEIESNILRQEVATRPKELRNLRNNVESTIFHFGCCCSDNKTKYRSLIKHKIWATARCLWINFVRIMKYLEVKEAESSQKVINYIEEIKNKEFFSSFFGIFRLCFPKIQILTK